MQTLYYMIYLSHRLNTVEVARESEYLSKISSLETKVTNLVRTQHQLENTIDSLRHDSREEELKLQIETLERSERALLRKIEILQQQSENYGSSNQVQFSYILSSYIVRCSRVALPMLGFCHGSLSNNPWTVDYLLGSSFIHGVRKVSDNHCVFKSFTLNTDKPPLLHPCEMTFSPEC